jgi:hypothetical protein
VTHELALDIVRRHVAGQLNGTSGYVAVYNHNTFWWGVRE